MSSDHDGGNRDARRAIIGSDGVMRQCQMTCPDHVSDVPIDMSAVSDEGSGTMAGVALVMVCGVLLTLLATVGNVMVSQSRTRAAADLSALSAAMVLWQSQEDPCSVAQVIAEEHGGRLQHCRIDGEDVEVQITMPTRIPLVPHLSGSARAGPERCP